MSPGGLMRILSCLTLVLVLLVVPVNTQAQTQASGAKDPQAVLILQQVLTAGGGATAINAIKDYTGSGTLVFHQSQDEAISGTVTVSGRWLDQFRIDETVPTGVRSLVFNQGRISRKREDGTLFHFPLQGKTPSSDAFPWQTPMFSDGFAVPILDLVTALNSTQFSVVYKGLVALNGKSVHDVQVQQVPPNAQEPGGFFLQYHTMDFFVDSASFQVTMTQNMIPRDVIRQIWYADYKPIAGVLVPFSISEQMGSQQVRDIQLSQINFNTGLQDSNFNLP